MAPECSHMTTICHFPFWFQWKHLSRLPKLWNFHLVDSKCFQIKFITNKFLFTGHCHFQLSNIRITKRFWLAGDDDYLRGATSINHQVSLRANFKMYSRSAKGGEKGDPNRNPWLAKMVVVISANFWKSKEFYAWRHFNDCVFSRHFGIYVFFNNFQFLVSHVHKFHIFVAVFLISMSHVHASHHIIYLYKVVPIKFVSLEVSC
jgi:hypothetical protein